MDCLEEGSLFEGSWPYSGAICSGSCLIEVVSEGLQVAQYATCLIDFWTGCLVEGAEGELGQESHGPSGSGSEATQGIHLSFDS